MAVGQVAGAKALALSMAPVVTTIAVFEEWCFHHINSYLGEKVVENSGGPAAGAPQAVGGLEEVVRLLLQSFAEQNNKQNTNGAAEKSDTEKVTPYTQYQVAKLTGYCNEFDTAQLLEFLKLVKTTKETEDHRMNLYRKMAEWSKKMGIDIDRGIFFTKETIDDIVKLRFNSAGICATLTSCEKGISNLLCLPREANEIEAIKLFEQAVEETKATRTLKEAERIANSTTRDPPTDYHGLKLMVATYAVLLWTLFGDKCHLYVQVLKIYKVLNQDEVFATRAAFDPLKCKQIAWAMFEDSRSFFWKRISPMDLAEGKQVEPIRSMLDDIIADVRFARNVVRSTFPLAWQDKSQVYIPPTGLPPASSQPAQQLPPTPMSFLSPYSRVFGPGFGVPPPPSPPPGNPSSVASKIAHVAPAIKAKFADYHKKFGGRVLLSRLLQL